jgi:hypothetical protein
MTRDTLGRGTGRLVAVCKSPGVRRPSLEGEHELTVLAGVARDAAGGAGGVALVCGEYGIGESSLVEAPAVTRRRTRLDPICWRSAFVQVLPDGLVGAAPIGLDG